MTPTAQYAVTDQSSELYSMLCNGAVEPQTNRDIGVDRVFTPTPTTLRVSVTTVPVIRYSVVERRLLCTD